MPFFACGERYDNVLFTPYLPTVWRVNFVTVNFVGRKAMELNMSEYLDFAKKIADILNEKKAKDIKIMEVGKVSGICDFFVFCNGTSTTHVKALADEIDVKLKEEGIMPHHLEGYRHANWILLDYSSVVVHIFLEEMRDYYKLERLWADAEIMDYDAD